MTHDTIIQCVEMICGTAVLIGFMCYSYYIITD